MFDKLQQLKQMRDLQKAAEAEKIAVEKQGVKLVITGSFAIEELKLNPELSSADQEAVLKDLWNEARQKVQQAMMGRLSQML